MTHVPGPGERAMFARVGDTITGVIVEVRGRIVVVETDDGERVEVYVRKTPPRAQPGKDDGQ